MSNPIIELKGITKTFGTGDGAVTALKDVDLTIYEGEILRKTFLQVQVNKNYKTHKI